MIYHVKRNSKLAVWLNGKQVQHVVHADTHLGYLVKYAVAGNGIPLLNKDKNCIEREILRGRVHVEKLK